VFFVSVASKRLRLAISSLESTLTGIFISVDSKEVRLHKNCATIGAFWGAKT
jgi:hypothetical protein